MNINIYGTLYVEVDCPECGSCEEVSIEVNQSDMCSFPDYDLDITIDKEDVIDALKEYGWVERNGKLICPDCAEEMDSSEEDPDDLG